MILTHTDIQIRVFRRSLHNIIIIWNINGLSPENSENLNISNLKLADVSDDHNSRDIKFKHIDIDDFENLKIKKDNIDGIVIDQKFNEIDPFSLCVLSFNFKNNLKFKYYVKSYNSQKREKEEIKILGYVPEERVFRPIELIKTKNGYCVKTFNVGS